MASRRPEPSDDDELPAPPAGRASIQDRVAAFVMLDGMKDKTQAEKSMRLRLIGFSNPDIAAMLQTTPAVIASNIYAEKKAAKKGVLRKGAAPEENGA